MDSETVMRVDELDATIQMMLYTDHTYTKAFSSAPTIELRDKVRKCSGSYQALQSNINQILGKLFVLCQWWP